LFARGCGRVPRGELLFQAQDVLLQAGEGQLLFADAGVEALDYAAGLGGVDFGVDDGVGLREELRDFVAADELETVQVPADEGEFVDSLGRVFVGGLPDAVVLLAHGFEGVRVDAGF
jgi:hypothetical protein